jgi:diaminopimelate epimerase
MTSIAVLITLLLSVDSFVPSHKLSFLTKKAHNNAPPSLSAKKVEFSKYHGLGNDFILINNLESGTPPLTPEESSKLCDRNFGIGADGVIFASKSEKDGYDLKMTIYNSDGTEPEMCGNGIRTLAQFLVDESAKEGNMPTLPFTYNIETLAGPILPKVEASREIEVDMGYPIFTAAEIPTTLDANFEDGGVVDQDIDVKGKTFQCSLVSMGNPHCVVFTSGPEIVSDAELMDWGSVLESHPAFPANTNVEFVAVQSDTHVVMKVYERGAGPTLACGTGACALVIAAVRSGRIPHARDGVRVTLPGGDLVIQWGGEGEKVYMTGPAVLSFKGDVEV